MLAMVGWVFPEMVYHLPNAAYSATNPLYAVGSVGFLPILQILLFIAVCEAATYKKVYEQDCENPGDFGIDPLGFSKTPERKAHYQLAEIKNGRLAMVAIGGAIHHALLTNVGLYEQIQSGIYCKLQASQLLSLTAALSHLRIVLTLGFHFFSALVMNTIRSLKTILSM